MRYDDEYRELLTLDDGTRVELRGIRPSDKALLREGFARLSPESRRRRFFTTKTGLSEEELRYLTEFDGEDHYAIGAARVATDGGEPEGIGVARFVRSELDPQTAEISIVVVDDWQRHGVGKLLLARITAAAAQRGIRRIRSIALADNPDIRKLLKHQTGELEIRHVEPGVVEFSYPISEPLKPDVVATLFSILRLVAIGSVVVPVWFGRETVRRLLARERPAEDDGTPPGD